MRKRIVTFRLNQRIGGRGTRAAVKDLREVCVSPLLAHS
jgi:hypothetical protein